MAKTGGKPGSMFGKIACQKCGATSSNSKDFGQERNRITYAKVLPLSSDPNIAGRRNRARRIARQNRG